MALQEKGIASAYCELNPFDHPVPPALSAMHPFGRVPVLTHDDFAIYETTAILTYLDNAFIGPALTPTDPRTAARMAQIIAICDAYAYRPLVRQVFSHGVFRPHAAETADPARVASGLVAAEIVLDACERIAAEALVLNATRLTLADIHLAPMISYFAMLPAAAAALRQRPALARWYVWIERRDSFQLTNPGLPGQ